MNACTRTERHAPREADAPPARRCAKPERRGLSVRRDPRRGSMEIDGERRSERRDERGKRSRTTAKQPPNRETERVGASERHGPLSRTKVARRPPRHGGSSMRAIFGN
ncbi:hypothetical protein J3L14_23360 [Burkholderia pseudomallei]|uniref:hypothetical protein n=2 Tax=Burkholderia pseudomallei TaxID=28450 RepID=UPI00016A9D9D|nr:hypothetical protein [Burkholderia pseudomallei]APZ01790.1 hypothetical protein BGI49_22395 [Burkholderia pseudomallei]APZ15375.1 hypothetical protein BGI52_22500 [Burkholderia pseudomallei]KAA8769896.1 hypothetical protein F5D26_06215 [Burkholderia pseudomallei]KIX43947.1 hypothetical protein SZ28_03785 [Burkholderia pseudomallei]KIX59561.1 hypothetical protein SZ29_05470 [Burkholderia pseudomallei]